MESTWVLQDVICECGPSVISASRGIYLCNGCGGGLMPVGSRYMAVLRSTPRRGSTDLTLVHSGRSIDGVPTRGETYEQLG